MLDTILGLLGSGGIVGILGGFANSWMKYKMEKDERAFKLEENKSKREHDLKMIEAETKSNLAEIEANVRRDKIISEGKSDELENIGRNENIVKLSENYVKSTLIEKMMFNTNKWSAWLTVPCAIFITFVHGLVDVSRTLVRVIVTYGSVAFSCYVTWMCFEMLKQLGVAVTAGQVLEILTTMLKLLTFTTSTVVSFWFMDRSMSRRFQEKN